MWSFQGLEELQAVRRHDVAVSNAQSMSTLLPDRVMKTHDKQLSVPGNGKLDLVWLEALAGGR